MEALVVTADTNPGVVWNGGRRWFDMNDVLVMWSLSLYWMGWGTLTLETLIGGGNLVPYRVDTGMVQW